MVRRGYRDPPYHNWTHAFTVAHFCFLLVTNLGLADKGLLRYIRMLFVLALEVLQFRGLRKQPAAGAAHKETRGKMLFRLFLLFP